MKTFWFFPILFIAFGLGFAASPSGNEPNPILPRQFSGWNLTGAIKTSKDPGIADASNTDVLKEYGFTDLASAVYSRDDGRKLTVKAARFQDASGAYGAFTFYKNPPMQKEKIGDQAVSYNERVLFYRGNIVVDAQFEKLSAMSAAELRDLASGLPSPPGNAAGLPGLPAYLPKQNYIQNSAKYIVGPAGLEKSASPINAQLVDFNAGAEVALADYSTTDNLTGQARLLLISYPTPQIANAHLQKIESAKRQSSPGSPLLDPTSVFDKRSGPIVAVVSGQISPADAKSILDLVNYEADVTWNQNTYFSRKDNPGNLIVNIIYLCAIIGGFAIIAGLAFGGLRILARRFMPDRLFNRPEMEFISLHLSGDRTQPRGSDVT